MNPIILALDVEPGEAQKTIDDLKGAIDIFKIGSRLFTALGPEIVERVHRAGRKVFLDLKFHDIPLTVAESCRNAVGLGVWGFTIHASGGFAMMKEAVFAVGEESERLKKQKTLIFGVTVLTSLSDGDLKDVGISDPPLLQVRRLAQLAKKSGLDGVVSSGNELQAIREECGKNFLTVVPGIRSGAGLKGEDQKRVMTAKKAIELGADYLVVGRPILNAKDRVVAAKQILQEAGNT